MDKKIIRQALAEVDRNCSGPEHCLGLAYKALRHGDGSAVWWAIHDLAMDIQALAECLPELKRLMGSVQTTV